MAKRVTYRAYLVVTVTVLALVFGGRFIYDAMGPDCSFVHANHGANSPEFSSYHIRRCAVKDKSPYDGMYW